MGTREFAGRRGLLHVCGKNACNRRAFEWGMFCGGLDVGEFRGHGGHCSDGINAETCLFCSVCNRSRILQCEATVATVATTGIAGFEKALSRAAESGVERRELQGEREERREKREERVCATTTL